MIEKFSIPYISNITDECKKTEIRTIFFVFSLHSSPFGLHLSHCMPQEDDRYSNNMLIIGPTSQCEKHSFLNELEQLKHHNPQSAIDDNVKIRRKLYKNGMTPAQVNQILGPSLYRSKRRIAAEKRAEEAKQAGEDGSASDNERASMDVDKTNRVRATANLKSYKKALSQIQRNGRRLRKQEVEKIRAATTVATTDTKRKSTAAAAAARRADVK